jgi:hypothetical protein
VIPQSTAVADLNDLDDLEDLEGGDDIDDLIDEFEYIGTGSNQKVEAKPASRPKLDNTR